MSLDCCHLLKIIMCICYSKWQSYCNLFDRRNYIFLLSERNPIIHRDLKAPCVLNDDHYCLSAHPLILCMMKTLFQWHSFILFSLCVCVCLCVALYPGPSQKQGEGLGGTDCSHMRQNFRTFYSKFLCKLSLSTWFNLNTENEVAAWLTGKPCPSKYYSIMIFKVYGIYILL